MDSSTFFKEKLATLLFLEIDKKKMYEIFHVCVEDTVFIPVRPENLAGSVKNIEDASLVPISVFVEGMFYELGADSDFKYSSIYKSILLSLKESIPYIKGCIYKEVKKEKYDNAYLLLKGLLCLENNKDNFSKLFNVIECIRINNQYIKDEELNMIEKAKLIKDYPLPYYYEALIKKDNGDFDGALFCINSYIQNGGEETKEITELKCTLKSIVDYEKGKELAFTDPKSALSYFIPLLDEFGDDPSLYYYIAVSYRILQNSEKAIYYLNEALAIDKDFIDVINELGINLACIGDYESAITYFRKAFEVTRSIEICTNLVMCYLNINDIEQAKTHMEIAKKIDPKDSVVLELESVLAKI